MNNRDTPSTQAIPEAMRPTSITTEEATAAIRALNRVKLRVGDTLGRHIEWAKNALWAATGPGNVGDNLLAEIDASADQVG